MQGAELEAIRNGFVLIEQRNEQVTQFGGKAVAELDAIMTAFRAEIVLNKSERVAEGEALKGELRQLVEHLQAKFLEVEGAIRTLTATAASAAATARAAGTSASAWTSTATKVSRPSLALPASPATLWQPRSSKSNCATGGARSST